MEDAIQKGVDIYKHDRSEKCADYIQIIYNNKIIAEYKGKFYSQGMGGDFSTEGIENPGNWQIFKNPKNCNF